LPGGMRFSNNIIAPALTPASRHRAGSLRYQIGVIAGNKRIGTGEDDGAVVAGSYGSDSVGEVDFGKDGIDFVKPVRAFSHDLKEKIDFRRRLRLVK
ncbi:MAG: hypothetical protein LIQ30_13400, partial [Planctomycetes bacterium]|nr:hypothetical protein [Planctomycetota bacterium]